MRKSSAIRDMQACVSHIEAKSLFEVGFMKRKSAARRCEICLSSIRQEIKFSMVS